MAPRQNVALPPKPKANNLGHFLPFRRAMLLGTPWEEAGFEYDLFCVHTVYEREALEGLVGRREEDGVAYVSIVRDPVDLFASMWDYYDLARHYNISLEDYVYQDKRRV